MIEGWLRHAELSAKARGLIPSLALWGVLAGVAASVALIFFTIAAYIWLSQRYDSLTAALTLAGIYLVLALVAFTVLFIVRRREIERARRALAARARTPSFWQDPRVLAAGVEIGRMIGWKKTVPLAALGLFAAGIAREWSNGHDTTDKH
ncbi:MAG: phage holin family protein [Pseudolabrys sp.]|jgi:putative superfamily III holin-X